MWALIPLKDFVAAKQRLSGVLSAVERRCLFQAMVEDVLAVLVREPRLAGIAILSDDPTARLLAEHFGIHCWSEKALGGHGLNGVVAAAMARLQREGVDSAAVVHGDLPLMRGEELAMLLQTHADNPAPRKVTIATDRHGDGSNVVVCTPPAVLEFAYGMGSCARHQANAAAAGADCQVLRLPGLSCDVDSHEDVIELLHQPAVGDKEQDGLLRALAYLRESGIAERLRMVAGEGANTDEDKHNSERDTG